MFQAENKPKKKEREGQDSDSVPCPRSSHAISKNETRATSEKRQASVLGLLVLSKLGSEASHEQSRSTAAKGWLDEVIHEHLCVHRSSYERQYHVPRKSLLRSVYTSLDHSAAQRRIPRTVTVEEAVRKQHAQLLRPLCQAVSSPATADAFWPTDS